MSKEKKSGLFSFIQNIIYIRIGDKLKPGSLKKLNDFFFSITEKTLSNFDIFFDEYLNYYQDVIEKEIEISEITKDDNILVIGCGTIPSTSIMIHKYTNSTVTGIDIDKKSVKQAIKCVKELDISEKVHIKHVIGTDYPLDGYSVIYIMFGVNNLSLIFSHIVKNMDDNARVIFRAPVDFKTNEAYNIDEIKDNFNIIGEVETYAFGKMKTIVLKKK